MKTIGLIGGMSWESSKHYYEMINEGVKERLGGLHSAKSVMVSVDFHDIAELQFAGKWEEAASEMADAARRLERAGADFIVLCTNTMHIADKEIERSIGIPFLHIADATAEKIKADSLGKIGLLGTSFTMEKDFYKGRLIKDHGIEVLIPSDEERKVVHDIIYDELCLGVVKEDSKEAYLKVIAGLVEQGAEGIILGCTEIGMLIGSHDVDVPVYDTTAIHASKAVELALE